MGLFNRHRKGRFIGMLFGLVGVLSLPMAVLAQEVPGVPPGTIPEIPEGTLPPEVEQAIDDALATALGEVVNFGIDGIAEQEARPGYSSASAVDLPGVITVGKSEATKTDSRVTVLRVLDQDLLVREGDANGGTYTGPLAPAGDVVDQINALGCPDGPAAEGTTCVMVLYSTASETQPNFFTRSNTAQFKAAVVRLPSGDGIELFPNSASSIVLAGRTCINIATSFIATGSGQLAPVSLIGLARGIGFATGAC